MKNIKYLFLVVFLLFPVKAAAQGENRQVLQQQLTTVGSSTDYFKAGSILQPNANDGNKRKSVFLAVFYSLILPGAGEYYADGYSRGKYFTAVEAGLWLTYSGFQIYGSHMRNDARNFAALNTGAQVEGKDEQFFIDMGNYDNVYGYNDKKLQDRRLDLIYDPEAGYMWQWKSSADRVRFRDLRISSDNILYNSRFVIAAIIANHILSAISAGKLAADYNKSLSGTEGNLSWRLSPQVIATSGFPDGFLMGIETSF